MQGSMEQCYAIKFSVKLKKTKLEAYEMLRKGYGDDLMSSASFYKWFNRFSEENKQVEDKPISGALIPLRKRENANVSDARTLNNCKDDI